MMAKKKKQSPKKSKKYQKKIEQNQALDKVFNFLGISYKNSYKRVEGFLFFLVIFFLPTQLGKHFWPDFSYIYSLKIDYLSPTIYFWDILVVGLFIFLLFSKRVNLGALGVLGGFLFVQGVSLLSAFNSWGGLVRLEQYFICGLFGLYIASQSFSDIKETLKKGLMFGVLMEGGISLLEFIFGRSLGLWILGERSFSLDTLSIANFNWYGQIMLRPYATFPHPNVMGAYMVISLLILIFISLGKKRGSLDYLALVFGALAALVSFSRGVAVVLFLELFFLFKNKIKWLLGVLIITLPFVFIRFNSALNFDILSLQRREELAEVALALFVSHPLLGVGLNNFLNASSNQELISGPNRFLQPVHNIFLLSLSETGVIGFLGYLGFLGYPLWLLRKVRETRIIFFVVSLFLIVISLGMFDHYFLTLAQGERLMFLIWGLSLSLISSTMLKDG